LNARRRLKRKGERKGESLAYREWVHRARESSFESFWYQVMSIQVRLLGADLNSFVIGSPYKVPHLPRLSQYDPPLGDFSALSEIQCFVFICFCVLSSRNVI
jgi:hypothetical protein